MLREPQDQRLPTAFLPSRHVYPGKGAGAALGPTQAEEQEKLWEEGPGWGR